ncbi:MAG TPA: transposase [Thiohalobacter sp.]|nr:transposase [Thiohalobacter sp.]
MPYYRRARMAGGTYFFTLVTAARRPLFIEPPVRLALRQSLQRVRSVLPFRIEAWVLLPDHLHCIWTLPEGDADYSKRWGMIKAGMTRSLRKGGFPLPAGTPTRRRREGGLWQRRFWEHWIRDHRDMRQHLDYIHYNPVKHGLVAQVSAWPHSSFHRLCKAGYYPPDWGGGHIKDAARHEQDYGEP